MKDELIIEGTLTKAFRGTTTYDKEVRNHVTIKSDSLPYEDIEAYTNVPSKLTPSWFKDQNGYMNLKSNFNIKIKNERGREMDFEDFIQGDTVIGSQIKIKVKQKEGALYPISIVVIEPGEAYNPFEGM